MIPLKPVVANPKATSSNTANTNGYDHNSNKNIKQELTFGSRFHTVELASLVRAQIALPPRRPLCVCTS